MSENLVVIVRSVFGFLTLLIFTRFLGKQQVAELTTFDYINGITIGSIAATLSTDLDTMSHHHIVGLATWIGMTLLVQAVVMKSRWWHKVIDSEPTVVIQNGKILDRNLRKLRLTIGDLLQQLRQKQVFTVSDVEFAVLEPSGQLSILLKSQKRPVTPADLNIPTAYEGLSLELVMDKKIQTGNLKQLGWDEERLLAELRRHGVRDIRQVFYAELTTGGDLYVDLQDDEELPGEVNDPSDYPGPN